MSKRRINIDPSYEKVLPEWVATKFRKQYQPDNTHCLCGYDLSKEPIVYYTPHSGGWFVPFEESLCWLYVKCPKCGYDMNLSKLGVPREC